MAVSDSSHHNSSLHFGIADAASCVGRSARTSLLAQLHQGKLYAAGGSSRPATQIREAPRAHQPPPSSLQLLPQGPPLTPPALEAPPLRLRGPAGEELPAHVAGAKPGWGPAGFPDCLSFAAVSMLETADGRVVNDVYVIMRHLIPALYGPAALTDAALAWERRLAYEYAPSLWAAASTADVATIFSRTAPAYPWLLTAPLSAAVHIGTKHVLLAEWATLRLRVGGEPQSCSLARIFADFRAALGGQPFVGGSFAGPTDLSFYGCTVLHYVTRCEPVTSLMTEHGLAPWHERMAALLPPRRALPPEGFGPSAAGYKMGWMCEPAQAEPVGARRDCVSR